MSLKAAFMVPHPPLIVSEIGKGREEDIIKTKESYEKVAEEIENINPDTIIILSPHTKLYIDGFYISKGNVLKGSFKNFGAENVSFEEEIDNLDETVQNFIKSASESVIYSYIFNHFTVKILFILFSFFKYFSESFIQSVIHCSNWINSINNKGCTMVC